MTARKLQLTVVEPDPDDPLGGLRTLLVGLEQEIRQHDFKSLDARYRSGHTMLRLRQNGRLPMNRRQALVEDLGISKTEISNRMKLAEKYQISDLSNVLDKFPTWYDVCQNALYDKRVDDHKTNVKAPTGTVTVSRSASAFVKQLATVKQLRPVDVRALRSLAKTINDILDAQKVTR